MAHVVAALVVVAGAILAAARPALSRRYEWVFWGAALVLVVTGIGNLGSLGPLRAGVWGIGFRAKLLLVLALLLLSAARVLARAQEAPARLLRVGNVASALLGAATLTLGLVIAHV